MLKKILQTINTPAKRMFSIGGEISTDMLVSLSLSHFDGKEFKSNTEMVEFMKDKSIISKFETFDAMIKTDRADFLRK